MVQPDQLVRGSTVEPHWGRVLNDSQLAGLVERIGYTPHTPALFVSALTHGSYNTAPGASDDDYQRLEFLGDRVLGLIIAEALYQRFPSAREGSMSHRLNRLVSRATCAEVARHLDIGPLVKLGKQARDDGARESDNVLGDVIEAIIGALFLDGGIAAARTFVADNWAAYINTTSGGDRHPKSLLLEWAAANRKKAPEYVVTHRSGPDHAPTFTVLVSILNAGEAEADGNSKNDAERNAAAALVARLEIEG